MYCLVPGVQDSRCGFQLEDDIILRLRLVVSLVYVVIKLQVITSYIIGYHIMIAPRGNLPGPNDELERPRLLQPSEPEPECQSQARAGEGARVSESAA